MSGGPAVAQLPGRSGVRIAGSLLVLLTVACASAQPPLRVEHVPGDATRRSATRSVVSTGQLSEATHIVLRRRELARTFSSDRDEAIAALHDIVALRAGGSDEYFALAELSFFQAEQLEKRALVQARLRDRKKRRGFKRRPPPYHEEDWAIVARAREHHLAAAIYAYTFLFTRDEVSTLSPLDPRARTSVDIYNRALALAFLDRKGYVSFASGTYRVPFGRVEVAFDESDRIWGNRFMVDFLPSDEFVVEGLQNRYRRPGLGAPLAARTQPVDASDPAGYLVAEKAVVSATAVLLIDTPREQLEGGVLTGRIQVAPWSESEAVAIGDRKVPLEAQPSAALAASLQESVVWQSRFGVFLGRITDLSDENRLFGWEPRLHGQIPVVFVHGTMSSPTVWADMVNDLQSDPLIRERYQFLFYSYQSGNPVLYSAMLFRRSLQQAVAALEASGQGACLDDMVLVGHSQGGLLIKALVIDSGPVLWYSSFDQPLEKMRFSKQSKAMLREAMFVEPLPFVDRVVFISTPHRGSYLAASSILRGLAARAIQFPADLSTLAADATGIDHELGGDRPLRIRNSIDNMSPRNEMIQAMASIPVDPTVRAHSIISVKGDGPVEKRDDGVVKYASAHIAEAESEYVVSSGHSSQAHPKTIEEMRRILVEHAKTAECAGSLPLGE